MKFSPALKPSCVAMAEGIAVAIVSDVPVLSIP